ncbi:MAG: MFS transporter [Acidobacteriaceae bacterium]|nr:MFS transporter [Acidobacteriaceae bacterium]
MSTDPGASSRIFFSKTKGRGWLSGFLLLGSLIGSTVSLPLAWDYHFEAQSHDVGLYFLGLNAGAVAGTALAHAFRRTASPRVLAPTGCVAAVLGWLVLAAAAPPAPALYRVLGLGFLGFAAGVIGASVFAALDEIYRGAIRAVAGSAGVLFGCGAFLSAAVIALTYAAGSEKTASLILATFSLAYAIVFGFRPAPRDMRLPEIREQDRRFAASARRSRTLGTFLFATLIFLQSGLEWGVAVWLPFFFVRRFGINPLWAIWTTAIYFLLLTFARVSGRGMIARTGHRKWLFTSASASVVGCIILAEASSPIPAWSAVCLVALGFAPIYPLLADTANELFGYTPAFYNGMFAVGITGAMTTSCVLGFVELAVGMRFVMLVPAAGSMAVLCVALLSQLEARLMADSKPSPPRVFRAGQQ